MYDKNKNDFTRIPAELVNFSEFDIRNSGKEQHLEELRLLHELSIGELALDSEAYDLGKPPYRGSFSEIKSFLEGRDDSARQVYFGKLSLASSSRMSITDHVAMKPFPENNPQDLWNEIAATNYLNSLDDTQNSFYPLGVYRTADGARTYISLFEHGVVTYDNVLLANPEIYPERLRPERVRTALNDCLWSLGYLHAVGIAKGDAEPKNFAHDGKNTRFIDNEDAQMLPHEGTVLLDNELSEKLRARDINTFFATSLQDDETRPYVANILGSARAPKDLTYYYKRGYKRGKEHAAFTSKVTPFNQAFIEAAIRDTRIETSF